MRIFTAEHAEIAELKVFLCDLCVLCGETNENPNGHERLQLQGMEGQLLS